VFDATDVEFSSDADRFKLLAKMKPIATPITIPPIP
jgi:hypothetical protein